MYRSRAVHGFFVLSSFTVLCRSSSARLPCYLQKSIQNRSAMGPLDLYTLSGCALFMLDKQYTVRYTLGRNIKGIPFRT